jgi:hypothetical protein
MSDRAIMKVLLGAFLFSLGTGILIGMYKGTKGTHIYIFGGLIFVGLFF